MSTGAGRVGVFGSLFNPPHVGHLILCSDAADQLGLDRVLLVPTARPAHRPPPAEGPELRYRLATAAAAGDPRLKASRVELTRPGPSFMVDTLRELAQLFPGRELVLLLGADQLAALGSWHEAPRIPELATIAVAPRPGVSVGGLDRAAVERVDMPLVAVSSSLVRERVRAGRSIRHLVPDAVRDIIEREGLYRAARREPVTPQNRPPAVVAWRESPSPVEEQP